MTAAEKTIYRRWRDKWQLALDAVMIDLLPFFDDPADVGDTRKELVTFVGSVVRGRKLSESVADAVLDAFAPSPGATTRKRARRPASKR